MRRTMWGALTVGLCLTSLAAYASLNMKPGLWETATIIQGKKASAEQKCYLQKDVDHLEKQMRGEVSEPKQPCVFANYKQTGNTVTVKMTCTFGGKPHPSVLSATYNGDTTTGKVISDGVATEIESKRLGDCTKSSFDKK
jgi:hypothetical protein